MMAALADDRKCADLINAITRTERIAARAAERMGR
jgi:hypothetical protein